MIKYGTGYKYQLDDDAYFKVAIYPKNDIKHKFITLDQFGNLLIKAGYAWDGPSGPTIDTEDFMKGSLVHDALYQLMGNGLLDESWRKNADKELIKQCKKDGMPWLRRWYVYHAVRWFGGDHLSKDKVEEV